MSTESGLPPVDPEVLDRAVEDALRGSSGGTGPRSPISEAVFSHVCREVEQAVREQAPVIAAAAYRPETDENRVTVDLSHLSKTDLEWFVNNPGSTAASKRIREAVAAALSDGRKK